MESPGRALATVVVEPGSDRAGERVVAGADRRDAGVRRPQGLRFRARPQPGPPGLAPTSPCAAADPSNFPRLRRLQVSWYAGPEQALPADLRAGQVWCLPLRLKRPHGLSNPVGFDVELWLFQLDIGAVGSVRGADASAAHRVADLPGYRIERLRQSVREAIARQVASPALAGVLAALTVGDQSSIESDDWDVFRRTGVAHLMAISGVHVTLFAWLAGGLAGGLWRRSSRCLLWCPAGRVGRWLGVGAAAAYALMAGWGVPAQRTVWMLLVWAMLRSLEARWIWSRVLLLAACVVALIDPWALCQPGFWLSFCAVALLMMQEESTWEGESIERTPDASLRPGPHQRLWAAGAKLCKVQCLTSIVLAPLGLIFFGQVSLVGLMANLLAIPWVTWVVTPLALLGLFWGDLWTAAAQAVTVLMSILGWLGSWPLAAWHAATAPVWLQGLGLLGAALLASPGPAGLRLLGLPLIVAMALPAPDLPETGAFTLWAFDIGQGNAVLVRTRRHALLFDNRPEVLDRGGCGRARGHAPAARTGRDRAGPAHRLAPRQRPHRWRRLGAAGPEGAPTHELARTRSSLASGGSSPALRGRPAMGLGRGSLRDPAPCRGPARRRQLR